MVSNANDDLPEPDNPVKTMSLSLGRSSETFLRLCSRAPRITRESDTRVEPIAPDPTPTEHLFHQVGAAAADWCEMASPGPAAETTAARRGSTRAVILLATMGALLLGYLVHLNAFVDGTHPANIVHPGADGPSADAILEDFPGHELPPGLGHDGQQFYAIARNPLHPAEVADDLDRPRYRLQRMAYPLTAWVLHPSGGGEGLVLALFAVGVAAVFAGSLATGLLSVRLGGGPLPALAFVIAPGAWIALRFTVSDTYALAAALLALFLSLSGRHRWAVVAAVLAVLAKESLILLPLGLLLHQRDRARLVLVAVPAVVAGVWWVALHALVDHNGPGVVEFTYPFGGLLSSARAWSEGKAPIAMLAVSGAFLFGLLALRRVGFRHPLGYAIAIQLAFLVFLGHDVLALDANGSRMTMPLLILAIVAWATRSTAAAAVADQDAATVDRAPVG